MPDGLDQLLVLRRRRFGEADFPFADFVAEPLFLGLYLNEQLIFEMF